MAEICLVMPYRAGDCLLALPIAKILADRGHIVYWVVHPHFADLFDGVSYVKPILFNGSMSNVEDACRVGQFGAPGAKQVSLRPEYGPIANPQKHFDLQIWQRASEALGEDLLALRETAKLVFDRRDARREANLCESWGLNAETKKPFLLFNFAASFSTKHPRPDLLQKWLEDQNAGRYNLVQAQKAFRIYDLLGVMEKCTGLVTIDTALTHLAGAVGLPVVDIVQDLEWHQPAPARHWKAWLTIGESMTTTGREKMAAAIWGKPAAAAPARKVIHVATWYEAKEPTAGRMQRAAATWAWLKEHDGDFETLRHSAGTEEATFGPKSLPYITNIVQVAYDASAGEDILALTNSDNLLTPDSADVIRKKMASGPCCFAARADVRSADQHKYGAGIDAIPPYSGTDLFCFTRRWWAKNAAAMSGMISGCEGWDWLLRQLMLESRQDAEIQDRIIYHEHHDQPWRSTRRDEGNTSNRRICAEWAVANGLAAEWADACGHIDDRPGEKR